MTTMISFCGLNCAECEAYKATQANDEAWKQRIAEKWSVEFNAPGLSATYVTCDGCLAFEGRLGGHCLECEIRLCGVERNLQNCAGCTDYPCEKLESFFGFVPQARQTLDEIRRSG